MVSTVLYSRPSGSQKLWLVPAESVPHSSRTTEVRFSGRVVLVDAPEELNLYCKACDRQHEFSLHGRVYRGLWSRCSVVTVLTVMVLYGYDETTKPFKLHLPNHVRGLPEWTPTDDEEGGII